MARLRHVGGTICAALGGVLFLSLLFSLVRVVAVPLFAVAGLAALGVLAALRPADALVALAVGVPIASWVGRQWNPAVAWPEALAAAFCAGYCARGIGRSSDERTQAIDAPVFSTIAIVAAVSFAAPSQAGYYSYGYKQHCFIKKIKSYDYYGNLIIKRVRVCR